jgi:ABC-type lipoprotein export system ATPase subunit
LVTHDQRAADRAHRELHLDKGQLVEQNGAAMAGDEATETSPRVFRAE